MELSKPLPGSLDRVISNIATSCGALLTLRSTDKHQTPRCGHRVQKTSTWVIAQVPGEATILKKPQIVPPRAREHCRAKAKERMQPVREEDMLEMLATFASSGLNTPSAHSEGDWYNNIWLEMKNPLLAIPLLNGVLTQT